MTTWKMGHQVARLGDRLFIRAEAVDAIQIPDRAPDVVRVYLRGGETLDLMGVDFGQVAEALWPGVVGGERS